MRKTITPRRFTARRCARALCFFALFLPLASAGCDKDDACLPQDAYCDGNTRVSCDMPGKVPIIDGARRDCGADTCVETENGAVCAVSPEPDERCSKSGGESFCDGKRPLHCVEGRYLVAGVPCFGDNVCIEVGFAGTICAEEQPSDECPPGHRGAVCAGSDALLCYDGYVRTRAHCGAPELCDIRRPSLPQCFVPGKPSCDIHDGGTCVDNVLARCDDGMLVRAEICEGACVKLQRGARCE